MAGSTLQFSVTRKGVDDFKVIVQDERSILRAYETTFAGARYSIIQELLALEVPKGEK
jgi:hypothetical protein